MPRANPGRPLPHRPVRTCFSTACCWKLESCTARAGQGPPPSSQFCSAGDLSRKQGQPPVPSHGDTPLATSNPSLPQGLWLLSFLDSTCWPLRSLTW